MAELWIYDFIGHGFFEDGVTAEAVRDDLAKRDKSERLVARINSPGGDVFEAVAIRTLLAQWPGGVDVQVDGLAASSASYIATVGERVAIAEGGMIMIHEPWTVARGNSAKIRKAAATLDKVADSLVAAYSRKAGRGDDEVREAMKAETWFTADEAIAFGLATEKAAEKVEAFTVPKAFGFRNAPRVDEPPRRQLTRYAAMRRHVDLTRARG